jgi:hypothetical protein
MAWYNSILGGIGLPPPPPPPYASSLMNSTSSMSPLGNPYAAAQARGSIVAVNGAAQSYFATPDTAVYAVKNYAVAIGWSMTHHHLPAGVTSDDPKIAMLKLIAIGEVLKDVGVRTSDTDYYVMRAPDV